MLERGGLAGRISPLRDERGSGLISTWLGLFVFLSILLFAVQVMVNLYANTVVNAAVNDAARLAASGGGGAAATADAEAHARDLLGSLGDGATFDWSASSADEVVLRVTATAPGVLPAAIRGPAAFGEIDRTVSVRLERFR